MSYLTVVLNAFAFDFNLAAVRELKIFEALAKSLALIKIPVAFGFLHSSSVHSFIWRIFVRYGHRIIGHTLSGLLW